MKNQEKHLETQQEIDKKRRFIGKAGLVTPVIATLASRPVFGAQCLSQQLSGNMSQTGPGSCNTGKPIRYWADPIQSTEEGGTIGLGTDMRTIYNFKGTGGLIFGHLHNSQSLASHCGSTVTPRPWVRGTEFQAIWSGAPNNNRLRAILCNGAHVNAHIVAAYLNALSVNQYILTTAQVIGLASGVIPVPGGLTLTEFLASTFSL